jgi:hypothetical protein
MQHHPPVDDFLRNREGNPAPVVSNGGQALNPAAFF